MGNFFSSEWEKIMKIESGAELHLIFLRATQALSVLTMVWALMMIMPMMLEMVGSPYLEGRPYFTFWLVVAVGMPAAQIAAAEYSLRAIQRRKFSGTLLGLVLAFFQFFSWLPPLGLFGFYCFLNRSYQEKNLRQAPKVFREFLAAVKMNRIPENSN